MTLSNSKSMTESVATVMHAALYALSVAPIFVSAQWF